MSDDKNKTRARDYSAFYNPWIHRLHTANLLAPQISLGVLAGKNIREGDGGQCFQTLPSNWPSRREAEAVHGDTKTQVMIVLRLFRVHLFWWLHGSGFLLGLRGSHFDFGLLVWVDLFWKEAVLGDEALNPSVEMSIAAGSSAVHGVEACVTVHMKQ